MLTQSIMPEDKRECSKDPTKDGTTHTQYFLMIWLKKNKDTEIISKLIFKIIVKMNVSKKYLLFYSVFGQTRAFDRLQI